MTTRYVPFYIPVMNRTAGRFKMLRTGADFDAFQRVLLEGYRREPLDLLAWRPRHWARWVDEPITPKELARLELSERRDCRYGGDAWVARTATRLRLQHTLRRVGRPPKTSGKQA